MVQKQTFTPGELKLFCQIGVVSGQVTFGSLFVALFPIDTNKLPVLLLSVVLTTFFWGLAWYLTKRYKL